MTTQDHSLSCAVIGDAPASGRDLLQYERYATPIVRLITDDRTETPFTIGIFGKWGTGKTTLMQMIEAGARKREYAAIWFNPWLYQSEENLVIPLLHTINDSLVESGVPRFVAAARKVAVVAAQVSLSAFMKTITNNAVSLEDIEQRLRAYNDAQSEAVSTIRKLRESLQDAVNEMTDNGRKGRLVIFVDDLDRCVPTNIISLLEAIKLFLDLKHAIIILAVDRDVVKQGIQVFYNDFKFADEEYDPLTGDYLDKIIQLPVYLQPLGPVQIENYLRGVGMSAQSAEQADLFKQVLLPNPRKIKRVLNIYNLTSLIADTQDSEVLNKSILAKLVVLQQQWNQLYGEVVRDPRVFRLLELVYRGKLDVDREEAWVTYQPDNERLRSICRQFYEPSSTMQNLFTFGDYCENVDLRPYIFLLR